MLEPFFPRRAPITGLRPLEVVLVLRLQQGGAQEGAQLDEACNVALLRSAKYKQALRRYHSHRVRGRAFNVGDLVLRLVQSNKNRHKLSPSWERPYVVTKFLGFVSKPAISLQPTSPPSLPLEHTTHLHPFTILALKKYYTEYRVLYRQELRRKIR